jgi:hypothetical protein
MADKLSSTHTFSSPSGERTALPQGEGYASGLRLGEHSERCLDPVYCRGSSFLLVFR